MPSKYELTIDALIVAIELATEKAAKELVAMLRQGVSPREALDKIYLSFTEKSVNTAIAGIMAKSLTTLLQEAFTPQVMLGYQVGGVSLSSKLYANGKSVAKEVETILTTGASTFQDLRIMSLQLFSGYNQKSNEVLKPFLKLPKYLNEALADTATEVERMTARVMATKLATDGMRAAYLQALDRVENGSGQKAILKAAETAAFEKARFLATRIVQNETAIAYHKEQAQKILEREDVSVVQIRPSSGHVPDICDAYLYADHYGLGAGKYPKEQAPRPPYHHHCVCRCISIIDEQVTEATHREAGRLREYLLSLPEEQQLKVAGSKPNLQRLLNGATASSLLNRGHIPEYRIRDLMGNELLI